MRRLMLRHGCRMPVLLLAVYLTVIFVQQQQQQQYSNRLVRTGENTDKVARSAVVDQDAGCCSLALLDPSLGLLDASRLYRIHTFVATGQQWAASSDEWPVCLSTHTSADRIFWLSHQLRSWAGPLSVALYAPGTDYAVVVRMISVLSHCLPTHMSRVALHVTYDHNMRPVTHSVTAGDPEISCGNLELYNKMLVQKYRSENVTNVLKNLPYPQNLLRNLARQGCGSTYSFSPDADMILPPEISIKLAQFLNSKEVKNCQKCAYIVPTYEIHENVTTSPVNKQELLELTKHGLARSFHVKKFSANQKNTNLPAWEAGGVTEELRVLYSVTSWAENWEPVYVTRSTVPLYQERFIGYGFTRSSQVLEMKHAGYSWHVLSNAFLCHRGFEYKNTSMTAARKRQTSANFKRYKKFKKELNITYTKK